MHLIGHWQSWTCIRSGSRAALERGIALVSKFAANLKGTVFRHACKLGFEGIVSKRLAAPYRSGPSRDWIKVKNPDSPAMRRARQAQW